MGFSTVEVRKADAPPIYPHSATYAGMLRDPGSDTPMTLGEFLDLSSEDGVGPTPWQEKVQRVLETGDYIFTVRHPSGLVLFAQGEPSTSP